MSKEIDYNEVLNSGGFKEFLEELKDILIGAVKGNDTIDGEPAKEITIKKKIRLSNDLSFLIDIKNDKLKVVIE